MKSGAILFVSILLIFVPAGVPGQVPVRDFQAWPSVRISKDLGSKWTISLKNEVRLEHNASQFDENVIQLAVDYSPSSAWQFSAAFREIRHLTGSGDFENRIRFHLDARYIKVFNRLETAIQVRIQSRLDQDEGKPLNDLRTRLILDYNIPSWKLDPFGYGEVDFRLPGRATFGYYGFRVVAGVNCKITPVHRLRLFYMLEREKHAYYPFTAHRLGLEYQIRLK